MDYGKWRYQQQKKEDKSRASNKGGQLKEVKFRTVKIGDHDLLIKVNHAREFLKDGNKVQFTLQFRGREMAHLDLGRDIMNRVKQELFMVSKIERDAKMEGRRMTMVLQPDGSKAAKIAAGQTVPGMPGSKPAAGVGANASGAGARLNIPQRPATAARS